MLIPIIIAVLWGTCAAAFVATCLLSREES
jgi:hypothetical protein